MCGKNFSVWIIKSELPGSPPRVREKRTIPTLYYCARRITPACAGKTIPKSVCGTNELGSPPRVREKLTLKSPACWLTGITPACAGKTDSIAWALGGNRDHPRVCGKNVSPVDCMSSMSGSPPRVREKHM